MWSLGGWRAVENARFRDRMKGDHRILRDIAFVGGGVTTNKGKRKV